MGAKYNVKFFIAKNYNYTSVFICGGGEGVGGGGGGGGFRNKTATRSTRKRRNQTFSCGGGHMQAAIETAINPY